MWLSGELSSPLWLHRCSSSLADVTVTSSQPIAKPTTLKVTIGTKTVLSRNFEKNVSVFTCKIVPSRQVSFNSGRRTLSKSLRELKPRNEVVVKLTPRYTLFKPLVQRHFSDFLNDTAYGECLAHEHISRNRCVDSFLDDGNGLRISLNIVPVRPCPFCSTCKFKALCFQTAEPLQSLIDLSVTFGKELKSAIDALDRFGPGKRVVDSALSLGDVVSQVRV